MIRYRQDIAKLEQENLRHWFSVRASSIGVDYRHRLGLAWGLKPLCMFRVVFSIKHKSVVASHTASAPPFPADRSHTCALPNAQQAPSCPPDR